MSWDEEARRVAEIFGVKKGEALPDVSRKTLRTYHTYLKANLAALANRGRLILVGTTSGAKAEIDFSIAMHKRLSIMGTSLRTRSAEEKATATRLFAAHVVPLLASGSVRPVIDKVLPMAEVRAAHQRIESNESFGKVVLLID